MGPVYLRDQCDVINEWWYIRRETKYNLTMKIQVHNVGKEKVEY